MVNKARCSLQLMTLIIIVWLLPTGYCWCPPTRTFVNSQHRPCRHSISDLLKRCRVYENVDADVASLSRLSATSSSRRRGRNYDSQQPYWEEEDDDEAEGRQGEQYFYNNDEYDDYMLQRDNRLEWETCITDAGMVHVLLPPASVVKPTVIIHFVGGTFFGSAPALWYKQLLQDIVRHTQAVIVASTIPVTLLQSPLQHVTLARKIQLQFQTAWRNVLLDEYDDQVLHSIPVCGFGHSLGSRLLVVLATMGSPPTRPLSPPPYKSFVLISFTNFGAQAGIPGIYQLSKASRRLDRQSLADQEKSRQQQRTAATGSRRAREDTDDWMNDEDGYDDDEDWGEIFDDFQKVLQEKANRVRSVLTPKTRDLEFHPSPDKLWKALTMDQRYTIPETLIIQFDNDEIDQSSKLALAVKESSSVRFARLRGTHLTPISANDNGSSSSYSSRSGRSVSSSSSANSSKSSSSSSWLEQVNSQAGRSLGKILMGRRHSKSNAEALRELRQSITSYITEAVTKT